MCPDYLTGLNKEQRRAAEHGVYCESATKSPPMLVIAGAGSGKTKTLAHRVAHLVVTGIDPNRILLLTFTRRAAEEMIQRVKRITAKALGVQQLRSAVVWYVPCHWRAVTSGIREPNRSQAVVYDS